MSLALVCDGLISLDGNGAPLCSTGWLSQTATIPFDASQIDPMVATAMFGAGFSLFIVPWASAWGVSQILKLLR